MQDHPPTWGVGILSGLTFLVSGLVWAAKLVFAAIPPQFLEPAGWAALISSIVGWRWLMLNIKRQEMAAKDQTLRELNGLRELVEYQRDELSTMKADMHKMAEINGQQAEQLRLTKHGIANVQQTVRSEAQVTREHMDEIAKSQEPDSRFPGPIGGQS